MEYYILRFDHDGFYVHSLQELPGDYEDLSDALIEAEENFDEPYTTQLLLDSGELNTLRKLLKEAIQWD